MKNIPSPHLMGRGKGEGILPLNTTAQGTATISEAWAPNPFDRPLTGGSVFSANAAHRSRNGHTIWVGLNKPDPHQRRRKLRRTQKASCAAWLNRTLGTACRASQKIERALRCLYCTPHNEIRRSAWRDKLVIPPPKARHAVTSRYVLRRVAAWTHLG